MEEWLKKRHQKNMHKKLEMHRISDRRRCVNQPVQRQDISAFVKNVHGASE